jgi:hypothetical protein
MSWCMSSIAASACALSFSDACSADRSPDRRTILLTLSIATGHTTTRAAVYLDTFPTVLLICHESTSAAANKHMAACGFPQVNSGIRLGGHLSKKDTDIGVHG